MLPGAVQHQLKAVLGAADFQEDAVAPVREFVHVQLPTKTRIRAVLLVQNPVLFVFGDYAQLATLSGGVEGPNPKNTVGDLRCSDCWVSFCGKSHLGEGHLDLENAEQHAQQQNKAPLTLPGGNGQREIFHGWRALKVKGEAEKIAVQPTRRAPHVPCIGAPRPMG